MLSLLMSHRERRLRIQQVEKAWRRTAPWLSGIRIRDATAAVR